MTYSEQIDKVITETEAEQAVSEALFDEIKRQAAIETIAKADRLNRRS